MASPNPWPFSFVVKKGLKIFDKICFGIPTPLSVMDILTYFPRERIGWLLFKISSFYAKILIFPPSGIACFEFIMILSTT
ncbi:MAG: hypothetical protein WH035_06980 [Spirochaetota bacterium]